MKPELTTNIKWYLATETRPGDDVYTVVAFTRLGYITTLSVCQGHFNCSYAEDINCENEFIPGQDVLYWAYLPEQLTNAQHEYEVTNSKE